MYFVNNNVWNASMKRDYCNLVDLKHNGRDVIPTKNDTDWAIGIEWEFLVEGVFHRLFMYNVLNFPFDVIVLARNLFPYWHRAHRIGRWSPSERERECMRLLFIIPCMCILFVVVVVFLNLIQIFSLSGNITQCFFFFSLSHHNSKCIDEYIVVCVCFYRSIYSIMLFTLYPFRCWNGWTKKTWNVWHHFKLLLFGGWSISWIDILAVSRLGCTAVADISAAIDFHWLLLDRAWIGTMAIGTKRLFKSSKNHQKSSSCEWRRIIGTNVTAIWIKITSA